MRRALLLLLAFFLVFGCLEEKNYAGASAERVANLQKGDLDSDGSPDYLIYDFAAVTPAGSGMTVQRQMTVSVQTISAYTEFNPELTDIDLLVSDQDLDEFSKSRMQSDTSCSTNIGLLNVVCSDTVTCSRLCSSQSLKCKKIASVHEEALAGSMISYVQDNNEIRSNILDARRMVLALRNGSADDRVAFLNKLRTVTGKVADINANPLYTSSEMMLCEHSDFGIPYTVSAAARIGNYSSQNASYHYRMIFHVKAAEQKAEGFGVEVGGVSLGDSVPKAVVPQPDRISSVQSVSATEEDSTTLVSWSSTKPSDAGYLFIYEFSSTLPPEAVAQQIKTPALKVRKFNLVALMPTNITYTMLNSALRNYYLAFGIAAGLTVAALIFIYNVVVLLVTMVREKAAGAGFIVGFRKAFGRTDVKWKTDSVIAVICLAAGYALATMFAVQPVAAPSLLEVPGTLLKNDMGMLGTGLVIIGVFMLYFAFDNIIKITILERAYGMVIRQEKDFFLAKAARLKSLISELEGLVEAYSKEDFDVSKEYDALTTLRGDNVDALVKDMNARNKTIIEDKLSRAESAVSSLKERKKLADENWPKWKETIANLLQEQNEVDPSSLITIPSSLRLWAMRKYAHEGGVEGVTFEREALRRKKVSSEELVRDMLDNGLLKGALVVSQDKVSLSQFAEGGGVVMGALAMKLRAYLVSLSKNLGQHPPSSLVVVGESSVLVMMKGRTTESFLFVNKAKFKEAIEQWKANMKMIEG